MVTVFDLKLILECIYTYFTRNLEIYAEQNRLRGILCCVNLLELRHNPDIQI